MEFDHIHFYVQDAERSRNWFINYLGFQSIGSLNQQHTQTEIVNQGSVYFLLSSPLTHHSPVYQYLQAHPSGVADVAFQVRNLESWVKPLIEKKVTIISPLQAYQYGGDTLKWLTIQGWGELHHTLIRGILVNGWCEHLSKNQHSLAYIKVIISLVDISPLSIQRLMLSHGHTIFFPTRG